MVLLDSDSPVNASSFKRVISVERPEFKRPSAQLSAQTVQGRLGVVLKQPLPVGLSYVSQMMNAPLPSRVLPPPVRQFASLAFSTLLNVIFIEGHSLVGMLSLLKAKLLR